MATRKTAMTKAAVSKAPLPSRTVRNTAKTAAADDETRTPALITAQEKPRSRKPLVNRDNVPAPAKKVQKGKLVQKQIVDDGDREPIKAFLRIRPFLGDQEELDTPYLTSLSDTTVQMTDLSGANRIRFNPQAQVYTFNHVFPPETSQPEFFHKTTLPLIDDVLKGQNGLIFTYGVTNSGKTYTIQGGSQSDTAGLLPRTLDVVFNSLTNVQGNPSYQPCGLASVEQVKGDISRSKLPNMDEAALAASLGELDSHGSDSTSLAVDKNYEYSVWISYAEVYNEKVYDLLAIDSDDLGMGMTSGTGTPQRASGVPRSTTNKIIPRSTSAAWANLATLATSTSNDTLTVKRKALALKNDPDAGGKYASGLQCLHVRSADEAKRLFKMGNINRRVFGTLANAVSSRSHGIFTLRIVKIHRADPSDVAVSRLSIVDLAGSERTKNTHNTGERLKEAGSINKSLMVLGQCMEAMRSNQRRLAATLAAPGRGNLDPTNPTSGLPGGMKLAIVPFRHSKLTELFQDFFVGEHEGRAVMIVNVNPYDTGFDENSHVMRFAALAREVTTAANGVVPKTNIKRPPSPAKRVMPKSTVKAKKEEPQRRKATLSLGGNGSKKQNEAVIEIVEEDDSDLDDGPVDLLVDALFEELEDLRIKLFESEMRLSMIEAETREEVMQEMEARMTEMQKGFAKRLQQAVEHNEAKTDAKIDMLHQFGAFNGKKTKPRPESESEAEETFDEDDSAEATFDNSEDEVEASMEVDDNSEDFDDPPRGSSPPSRPSNKSTKPQTHQSETKAKLEAKRKAGPVLGLRDEDMSVDEMDADDAKTEDGSEDTTPTESEEESESGEEFDLSQVGEDESEEEENEEGEEEYVPPPKAKKSSPARKVKAKATEEAEEEDDADTYIPLLKKPSASSKTKAKALQIEDSEDDDDADSYIPPLKPSNSNKLKPTKSPSRAKANLKVDSPKSKAKKGKTPVGVGALSKKMDTLSLFADEEENVPPEPISTSTEKPKRQVTRNSNAKTAPSASGNVRRSTRLGA